MNKKISTAVGILIIVLVITIFAGGILAYQNGWISKFYISTPAEEKSLITAEEVVPFIKIISPNGGENWVFNTTNDISWESYGIDAVSINLMVYYDGDYDFMVIADGIPANIGKYSYQIKSQLPLTTAEKFKIQIIGYNNGSKITDESDKDFYVREVISGNNVQEIVGDFCHNRNKSIKSFSLVNFEVNKEQSVLVICNDNSVPPQSQIYFLKQQGDSYVLIESEGLDAFLTFIQSWRTESTPEIIDIDNDGIQEILAEGSNWGGPCTGHSDYFAIYSPKYDELFYTENSSQFDSQCQNLIYSFYLSPNLQNIEYQAFKLYLEKFKSQ